MPIIVRIGNARVYIYADDHNPPHFHIVGPDFNALVRINDLTLLKGTAPPDTMRKVLDGQEKIGHCWHCAGSRSMARSKSMDQPRVATVESLPGTMSVAVTWIDGTRDVVDLSDPNRRFTMLRPLADPALFAKVKVVAWGWAIGWGDAEDPDIDYPADRLWQRAQDQRRAAA